MIPAGAKVRIHYTLTVGGRLVDSSTDGEPLAYVHGMGQIVPGLEDEVGAMNPGDRKRVSVAPEKGYGPVDPRAFVKVPKKAFEGVQGLEVGIVVRGRRGDQEFQAVVHELSPEELTLDLNHPLAGKVLDFDIEVLEVEPPRH